LNKEGVSYRATFLIDENFNVRYYSVNDLPLGRNIDEILRMIDALDHHTKYGDVCPAGWTKDKKSMKPSQVGVSEYLKENIDIL
jgi:peroxiredoxin (alkyl hydroperoxide reductase subunit C)